MPTLACNIIVTFYLHNFFVGFDTSVQILIELLRIMLYIIKSSFLIPKISKYSGLGGKNNIDSASTTIIVTIALFAVIVVAASLVSRSRAKVRIKGPLNTSLELDARQDNPNPKREQSMKISAYGDQEMSGQGADQKQDMQDSPLGKQTMS